MHGLNDVFDITNCRTIQTNTHNIMNIYRDILFHRVMESLTCHDCFTMFIFTCEFVYHYIRQIKFNFFILSVGKLKGNIRTGANNADCCRCALSIIIRSFVRMRFDDDSFIYQCSVCATSLLLPCPRQESHHSTLCRGRIIIFDNCI